MKAISTVLRIATAISVLALFPFCTKVQKDVKDYYPSIVTNSVTMLDDGSVDIRGTVTDEGPYELDFLGFCADTLNPPDMLSMQINKVAYDGHNFSAVFPPEFALAKTYYFRTWAANGYGYVYGNTLSLSNIKPLEVTPPCNPSNDYLSSGINTDTYNDKREADGFNYWQIDADGGKNSSTFKFYEKPRTGVYFTTTTFSPMAKGWVYISNTSGFSTGVVQNGGKVYVNQTSPGHWEITCCSLTMKYNTAGNAAFTCKLIYP